MVLLHIPIIVSGSSVLSVLTLTFDLKSSIEYQFQLVLFLVLSSTFKKTVVLARTKVMNKNNFAPNVLDLEINV